MYQVTVKRGSRDFLLQRLRRQLAQFGLDTFCFFALLGVAGAYIGLGLLLIATILDAGRAWKVLSQDTALRLLLLFSLPLGIGLILGLHRGEVEPAAHWAAAGSLLKLWLFLLVAYWLAGEPARVWRGLGLALAGFVLGRILEWEPKTYQELWQLQRPGLGFTAIALAQYTAAALLGLLLAAPHIWHCCGQRDWVWQISGAIMVGGLIIALLMLLMLSLSRGVWLSLALCLVWLGWLHYRAYGFTQYLRSLGLISALLTLGVVVMGWDLMAARFSQENHILPKVLDEQWDEVGFGSVGIRLNMWSFGLEHWLQRPWFGWGPGALPALLQNEAIEPLQVYDDLHNILLEFLVRLGLVGTVVLALTFAVVMGKLSRARRTGEHLPEDLYLLLYGALLLHLLCGISNFRMFNSDWNLYWYLFAGSAYSFALFPPAAAVSTSR